MLFTEGPQELGQPITKVHSLSLGALTCFYISHTTYIIKILGYAQHASAAKSLAVLLVPAPDHVRVEGRSHHLGVLLPHAHILLL